MAQQHTPAAGSGQPEQHSVQPIEDVIADQYAVMRSADLFRRLGKNNLARAELFEKQLCLLRDHRANLSALGDMSEELDDAFSSALVALGAEAYQVKQQGLELAKHADDSMAAWQEGGAA